MWIWPYLCAIFAFKFEANILVAWYIDAADQVSGSVRYNIYNNKTISLLETKYIDFGLAWFMMFNTTFNNISVISWRSVLLVEETEVPRENHHPVASHSQTSSHNIVSSTPCLTRVNSVALCIVQITFSEQYLALDNFWLWSK